MENCTFCKIAKKEAPSAVEHEDNEVLAFKNINPVSEVHILIIPKVHVESFTDPKAQAVLPAMAKAAQQIIKAKSLGDGYKILFNGGKYQAIHHLHMHLLSGKLENESDPLHKT